MNELEIEQGYANFHRGLNRILRQSDVQKFKAHLARNPHYVGKLSRCFGFNDELIEVEMYREICLRSALKDIHPEAIKWLKARNIDPPKKRAWPRSHHRR